MGALYLALLSYFNISLLFFFLISYILNERLVLQLEINNSVILFVNKSLLQVRSSHKVLHKRLEQYL